MDTNPVIKDKYELAYPQKNVSADLSRLINQIWKLLPMREHQEDWQKQLNSVLVELRGLHELFGDQLNFLILLTKLEGLRAETNFMTYRVVVFSSITLLSELNAKLK